MRNPSRHPPRASRTEAASMAAGLPPRCSRWPLAASAQEKAAGVFDEEPSRPRRSRGDEGRGRGEGRRREEAEGDEEGRGRLRSRLDRLHPGERLRADDRAGRADVPALRGAPEPGAGERLAAEAGPELLPRGADPPADEGDPGALEGGPAQEGRDGGPRAPGEARTPPEPAARRGPRLPDEAGAAPADARGARPARSDHQGRTARARLVALRRRRAEGAGGAEGPEDGPGGARPRPEGRDRRHPGLGQEGR